VEPPLRDDPTPLDERVPLDVVLARDRPTAVIATGEGSAAAGTVEAVAGALAAEGFASRIVAPASLTTALADAPEALVLVEVPARRMPLPVTDAIARWLGAGGGLMVVGGRDAFGPGGYADTPIDALLPVRSRPRGRPARPLRVVVALDRSGSMAGETGSGRTKLVAAVEALGRVVGALGAGDRVGVVTFARDAELVLQPGAPPGPAALRAALSAVEPGGDTDVFRAVGRSITAVRGAAPGTGSDPAAGAEAPRLHVVLVSDGRSEATPEPGAASAGVVALAAEAPRVTVSVVAIGPDADRELLGRLAAETGGERIDVADARELAQALGRALDPRPRELWVAGVLPVRVGAGAGALGLDAAALAPTVRGAARTSLREAAREVAAVEGVGPLAAAWEARGGRVVAYASPDAASQGALVRALARGLAPPGAATEARVWREPGPGGARVLVESAQSAAPQTAGTSARDLVLRLPGAVGGGASELPLVEVAPGRWASPPLDAAAGRVGVVVERHNGRRLGVVALREPVRETALDPPDAPAIGRIVDVTGGVRVTGAPGERLPPPPGPTTPGAPWGPFLALVAAAAFVLERALA
jgi:Mg-chelatase subunit ChlD